MTTDFLSTDIRKRMTPEERAVAIGVLHDAGNLILATGRWTQFAYARDAHGTSVDVHDVRATCWCMRGAIRKMAPTQLDEIHAMQLLLNHVNQVGQFNDTHTQLEVVALLRGIQ